MNEETAQESPTVRVDVSEDIRVAFSSAYQTLQIRDTFTFDEKPVFVLLSKEEFVAIVTEATKIGWL